MVSSELHTTILTAKKFLNNELVKLKNASDTEPLAYREIADRLDMLHEIERIGYRNLSERDLRKLQRMLGTLNLPKVSEN